eukprot:2260226-Prymnesium_polylepis.1
MGAIVGSTCKGGGCPFGFRRGERKSLLEECAAAIPASKSWRSRRGGEPQRACPSRAAPAHV